MAIGLRHWFAISNKCERLYEIAEDDNLIAESCRNSEEECQKWIDENNKEGFYPAPFTTIIKGRMQ